jgi:dipeptidyl-peptidase-3
MREYTCPCCGIQSVIEDEALVPSFDLGVCGTCSSISAETIDSVYSIPTTTPICRLEVRTAFHGLTDRERAYAYWIGRASWDGAQICLAQTSPESVPIFCMLLTAFKAQPIERLVERALARGCTQVEIERSLMYSAAFFSNMGNYKSMGDTKFIPQLPVDRFQLFLFSSECNHEKLNECFALCRVRLYSLTPRHRQVLRCSIYLA